MDANRAHTFQRSGGAVVVVAAKRLDGRPFVDMRTHIPDLMTGQLRPTQKGVTFALDQLEELLEALQDIARTETPSRPLLTVRLPYIDN